MVLADHGIPYKERDFYSLLIDGFTLFSSMVVAESARLGRTLSDVMIRNFIAKSVTMLKSIDILYSAKAYDDAWILHRSLIDRYLLLEHLAASDEWKVFDDWSFFEQHKANEKAKNSPEFGSRINPAAFKISDEQSLRYKKLAPTPPKWRRPKPKEVAKKLDYGFIYQFGYDFSSTLVHPMANDGEQSVSLLLDPEAYEHPFDQRVLLNNSCLVAVLLVQAGLNHGGLEWRRLVHDFNRELLASLNDKPRDLPTSLTKLRALRAAEGLCQQRSPVKAVR